MLRSLASLKHFRLDATDGEIGAIKDVYFDDEVWRVRYFEADTGTWLPGKRVLIPVVGVLEAPNWASKSLPVRLTKEQIKDSPTPQAHKPVSRQEENRLHAYYGYLPYWPGATAAYAIAKIESMRREESEEDSHLRSLNEVMGYKIAAKDNTFGHVEDLIVNDEDWALRFMVVDTKNWLPAKQVLVSPEWATDINWSDSTVTVNLTEEELKNSPEYRPTDAINLKREGRLYDYYGRPRSWEQDTQVTLGPLF